MRNQIVDWLEKFSLKLIMIKVFGAVIGGVKGLVITFLYGRVWKAYVRPLLLWAFRKVKILFKRPGRKKQAQKILKAKDDQAILDAINNLD